MKVESVLLRVLYFGSDSTDKNRSIEHIVDACSQIEEDLGIDDLEGVNETNISESLSNLENHLLVKVDDDQYTLTSEGVDRAELLMTDSQEETEIENIVHSTE